MSMPGRGLGTFQHMGLGRQRAVGGEGLLWVSPS